MDQYNVIGIMSGTSLDGLDIAYCQFEVEEGLWNFKIKQSTTVAYDADWKKILSGSRDLPAVELDQLDRLYGTWIGEQIQAFIKTHGIKVDFISSHGHTVLHEPSNRQTRQIGSGVSISEVCGLPIIYDFRALNVTLGGQGAPLVPIGDLHLFADYPYCLNLGGIANLSYKNGASITAFDICICNTALNFFAANAGLDYDEAGGLGQMGQQHLRVVDELNSLDYFSLEPPKSLDSSYFYHPLLPVLENSGLDNLDQAASFYRHIADQVSKVINTSDKVLVTGGGAYNTFLMQLFIEKGLNIEIPSSTIVDFKEALVFAFMGVLRLRKEVNCLQSVCGGPSDMCLGEMHGFQA